MDTQPKPRSAKIAIVGAGPAGLSAAYFLRKRGFTNVTVYEKLGRVGGLCRSITEDNASFDLGAMIVTHSYHEVRRIAKQLGVKLSPAYGSTAVDVTLPPTSSPYIDLYGRLMGGTSLKHFLAFGLLCLRYLWCWSRYRRIICTPGWRAISQHKHLCVPFAEWLDKHKLTKLAPLFELPLYTFGYGHIDAIPTPYVLRYLTPMAFIPILLSSTKLAPYMPSFMLVNRFEHGYQRFWERVSWDIDVRLNHSIKQIDRAESGVTIRFDRPSSLLGSGSECVTDAATFDYLILACPLLEHTLSAFMKLSVDESDLLSRVRFFPYSSASYEVKNTRLNETVTFTFPIAPAPKPTIVTQQRAGNELMTFYAYATSSEVSHDHEREIFSAIRDHAALLGGTVRENDDHTFDVWPYFRHVSSEEFSQGYYDRWENIQGDNRTYHVGGLFDFDFVEGITSYSQALVDRHFAGVKP